MSDVQKTRTIQITITEKCNLNCTYCYEHHKNCGSLSLDYVKDIFRRHLAEKQYDEIHFDFLGGEPALAFDVLRPACEWLWENAHDQKYICFASTNGTLIHGEIQDWFRKNAARFWLGLSLDGTREMQNVNRSNSYDEIDFSFFRETWPDQTVKMTISPQTLPNLCEGIFHIYELGFGVSANLAHGVKWPHELLPVYREQLQRLADFYLENPEYTPVRLVDFDMRKIGAKVLCPELSDTPCKWCGTGERLLCYGVDGNIYPCQMFAPSSTAVNGKAMLGRIDFSCLRNFADPRCSDCCLTPGCPTCYGMNYVETGNISTRPRDMCDFYKCEAVATSYLYGKMLADENRYPRIQTMKPSEKLACIRGIEIVQRALADQVAGY